MNMRLRERLNIRSSMTISAVSLIAVLVTIITPGSASAAPAEAACGHSAHFSRVVVRGKYSIKMVNNGSCSRIRPFKINLDARLDEFGGNIGYLPQDEKYIGFNKTSYTRNLYGQCTNDCTGTSILAVLQTDFYFSGVEYPAGPGSSCVLIEATHLVCLQTWNLQVFSNGSIHVDTAP